MSKRLVQVGLGILLLAIVGGGIFLWKYKRAAARVPVSVGIATEVTAQLQRLQGDSYFFVETPDHRDTHKLRIVNSLNPDISTALATKLGKTVTLFGIRDASDSDDFAVLWMDGTTLQQETDALAAFNNVSFRQIFQHATVEAQRCLTDKLGQAKVDILIKNREETLSEQESAYFNQCFIETAGTQ